MEHVPSERLTTPRTITPMSVPAVTGFGVLRFPLKQEALTKFVRDALDEDGAFNDITTIATVVSDRRTRATLVARSKGVICGVRIEEIQEPTMKEIRYLDKLVDELAKGKSMDKILRRAPTD